MVGSGSAGERIPIPEKMFLFLCRVTYLAELQYWTDTLKESCGKEKAKVKRREERGSTNVLSRELQTEQEPRVQSQGDPLCLC